MSSSPHDSAALLELLGRRKLPDKAVEAFRQSGKTSLDLLERIILSSSNDREVIHALCVACALLKYWRSYRPKVAEWLAGRLHDDSIHVRSEAAKLLAHLAHFNRLIRSNWPNCSDTCDLPLIVERLRAVRRPLHYVAEGYLAHVLAAFEDPTGRSE